MLYKLIRPLLFSLDAETTHNLGMAALGALPLLKPVFRYEDPRLRVEALGLTFPNPIGLAAGFDKNGTHLNQLAALGFGFIEAGTVTLHPQPGNPKPRIRRIPEARAIWNRLGFNNQGAEAMAKTLKKSRPPIPIGINLGKSKITPLESAAGDYLASFRILFNLGDYFVLNVSSPNTAGLRTLQNKAELSQLLAAVQNENAGLAEEARIKPKALLVKIAPDLEIDAIDEILEVALKRGVSGVIATNTTLARKNAEGAPLPEDVPAEGGISGSPLAARSTAIIRHIYKQTGGKLTIIGVGGVFSAEDALEKIEAGATLVQIFTGMIYEGPGIVKEIKTKLARAVKESGKSSVRDLIGVKAG